MALTFHKNERLTRKTLMSQLFDGKDSVAFTSYPLKVVYALTSHHADDAAIQMMVSVSKRHFKRAVKRNRVKRQVREAYRLNKSLLPRVPDGQQLLIAFLWLSDDLLPTSRITHAMTKAMNKLKIDE